MFGCVMKYILPIGAEYLLGMAEIISSNSEIITTPMVAMSTIDSEWEATVIPESWATLIGFLPNNGVWSR